MGNLNNGALERDGSRRVAMVTGGSRGIGRACAVGLAVHCEMFQPENILQKNQFPKNWKDTGLAEGFQSRLKDSRAQFFSRKADGQGICEHAERFEGFFKVLYIEYYERPYLTEKSKISSWNMYVVLLCSETYLTLSTKISHFSLQQYRPHCPKLKQ